MLFFPHINPSSRASTKSCTLTAVISPKHSTWQEICHLVPRKVLIFYRWFIQLLINAWNWIHFFSSFLSPTFPILWNSSNDCHNVLVNFSVALLILQLVLFANAALGKNKGLRTIQTLTVHINQNGKQVYSDSIVVYTFVMGVFIKVTHYT